MTRACVLAAVYVVALAGAAGAAEVPAELKGIHMCCPGCSKAVAGTLQKVEGVTGVAVDQKTATAKFAAADEKAAQRALDALAAAGFHGDTGFAFKDDSGVKAGTVASPAPGSTFVTTSVYSRPSFNWYAHVVPAVVGKYRGAWRRSGGTGAARSGTSTATGPTSGPAKSEATTTAHEPLITLRPPAGKRTIAERQAGVNRL